MKLTIFTPTYNRELFLPALYESIIISIKEIDSEDTVEWIIVDDGSPKSIERCVKSFSQTPKLAIRLFEKENGGKHTAFNVAIENAESDIFVCVDDDDRLTANALHDIFNLAKIFNGKGYGGVVGRVVDESGLLLGKNIFQDYLISNTIEIRDKYGFWGEPEIFYTPILKKYRFDVFPHERFLTEAYVFDEMSTIHPFVYSNIPMMVKKYYPGGLTDNQLKIRMQCPMGCEAYYYKRKMLCKGFKHKLKAEINRQRFGRYSKNIPKRRKDIYTIIAIPIAEIMSLNDRSKFFS